MKDMIKRIRAEREGFTLAELLIVVAIIAVLVAIAIPVFSAQLEKSREATDLANTRAAYAEVMTAAITGDTDVKTTSTSYTIAYDKTAGTYTATVPCKQTEENWQTGNVETVGGVDVSALAVGKDVNITVTYTVSSGNVAITAAAKTKQDDNTQQG